jgi:hypothetical protein
MPETVNCASYNLSLHSLCDATCTILSIMLETKQHIQDADLTRDGGTESGTGMCNAMRCDTGLRGASCCEAHLDMLSATFW